MDLDWTREDFDICIIGGGASGLLSSIVAAGEPGNACSPRILLLEKNDKVGRKLSATGNGRGNLSNLKCEDWEKTCGFFSSIGIMTKADEEGRIYPYSEDASDITRRLEEEALRRGVEIRTNRNVVKAETVPGGFLITVWREEKPKGRITEIYHCKKLLLATGGKSYPIYGTTGEGYGFARAMGHSVSPLAPALTGIETEESPKEMGISGVRAKAIVTLYRKDLHGLKEVEISKEEGQVQFTDYGLSGICIFDLTPHMAIGEGVDPREGLREYSVSIDLLPEMSEEEIGIWIKDRREAGDSEEEMLCSLVNKKLAKVLASLPGGPCPESIKDFRFSVKNLCGWKQAQITRGGVLLQEVNMETMESKLTPNLFFAGEILDYAGPCGGFNLQFAWTTGMAAGKGLKD